MFLPVPASTGACPTPLRKTPGHTAAGTGDEMGRDGQLGGEIRGTEIRRNSTAQGYQLGRVGLRGAIITANLPEDRASF